MLYNLDEKRFEIGQIGPCRIGSSYVRKVRGPGRIYEYILFWSLLCRLIKSRKLVLLVDLDQTLIHTTNDNIPPNIRDVYHFQLYGSRSPWYHTR